MKAIEIQTLKAFVAVAREGNVSRAALGLNLSQPAVSLQLRGLSEATGLELFSRTPRGLALTGDGLSLLPQAEKALAAMADFSHKAMALHGSVRGKLRIGTILDPEFIRLGVYLRQLVESAPQIETELRQCMSGDVLEQVLRRHLDVGFYLGPPGVPAAAAPLECRELTRFTYRVIAPAGWGPQLAGRDWLGLAGLPWLDTPPASVHHRLLAKVFGEGSLTGVVPRKVAMVDHEASMLDLVKSGVGLSLARDAIAMRESQTRGLAVADGVSLDCSLSFICLASRVDEPVVASALGALTQAWR
jgi:DNA-binding transcriptional LysR family regulator